MQSDKENQHAMYISGSKKNIDDFIERNNYKAAFGLLIVFLERLEDNEKKEVIDYYSKNLQKIMLGL
jgi:hypothetical protein